MSASTSLTDKVQMEAKIKVVVEQIGLLNLVEDLCETVIVEMKEPMDPKVFTPLLRASITKWKQQGKKATWIKLSIEHASLIEPLIQEGFRYHHDGPGYIILVYWIRNTPDTLPENASH